MPRTYVDNEGQRYYWDLDAFERAYARWARREHDYPEPLYRPAMRPPEVAEVVEEPPRPEYPQCRSCGRRGEPLNRPNTYGSSRYCRLCVEVCERCSTLYTAGGHCRECAVLCRVCRVVMIRNDADRIADSSLGNGFLCDEHMAGATRCDTCEVLYLNACAECFTRDSRIHNYSYKPEPYFRGDRQRKQLYFGVEQELASRENAPVTAILDIVRRYDPDERLLYGKSDSSIGRGVEVVSHPMTFDFFESEYPLEMQGHLQVVAEATYRCGIHIHMSKAAFTALHMYKFLHFHYDNRSLIKRIAGRDSHFAQSETPGSQYGHRIVDMARKKSLGNNRSTLLNMGNEATVEARYFRSTTNPDRLAAYMEWLQAVYEFTDAAATPNAKGAREITLTAASFRVWADTQRDRFPHLSQLVRGGIREQGLIVDLEPVDASPPRNLEHETVVW